MRYIITLLLLLMQSAPSFAQWNHNGTGLPIADSHYVAPLIQYSAYHNQFFVLSEPISGVGSNRLDTMHIQNSNWAMMDSSITASNFIATRNGEFVFLRVNAGELELTGTDEELQQLWTSSTSGLNLQHNYLMEMYEGENNDIYIQYDQPDTSVMYRFMNNTWTHLGEAKGKLDFFTNGDPVALSYISDVTVGAESRTYYLETYNGTSWDYLDSATAMGDFYYGTALANFSISKLDSIYLVDNRVDSQLFGSYVRLFKVEQSQIDLIDEFSIGIGQAFGMDVVTDSLADPHVFYHTCDLGWNEYLWKSYDQETRSSVYGGLIYNGHPIEIPRGYNVVVDEFNCLQYAYSYHLDFFGTNDTTVVEVIELCTCEYIESRNVISNQGGIITSNITELADYQWLDCENNYAPILGETSATFTPTSNGAYALEVTINGCVDTTDCQEISGIGIDEIVSNSTIHMFPNPASENIHIEMHSSDPVDVILFDIRGKRVAQHHTATSSFDIDISRLSAGTYTIQVLTDNEVFVGRLMVE